MFTLRNSSLVDESKSGQLFVSHNVVLKIWPDSEQLTGVVQEQNKGYDPG